MLVTPILKTTPDGREISLTVGRIYEVLGIEADDYRILTNEDHPWAPNDPVWNDLSLLYPRTWTERRRIR